MGGLAAIYLLREEKLAADEQRKYDPAEYASKPESLCLNLPASVAICFPIEGDPGQDAARSDDDLRAQQEMADWAFWMVIASVAGLTASVVGVVLIYFTFSATRRQVEIAKAANDQSKRHAELTMRAQVLLSPVGIQINAEGHGQPNKIRTTLLFQNDGISAARHMTVRVTFYVSAGDTRLIIPGMAKGNQVTEVLLSKALPARFEIEGTHPWLGISGQETVSTFQGKAATVVVAKIRVAYFDDFTETQEPRKDLLWLRTELPGHLTVQIPDFDTEGYEKPA